MAPVVSRRSGPALVLLGVSLAILVGCTRVGYPPAAGRADSAADHAVRDGALEAADRLELGSVVIADVTVEATRYVGIRGQDSPAIEIKGCTIKDGTYNGIMLNGCDQALVEGNTLFGNNYGIIIYNSDAFTVRDNQVHDNHGPNMAWGIYLNGTTHGKLEGNTVLRSERGITLDGSSDTTLTQNRACENASTDIINDDTSNSGQGNTCDTTTLWDDQGYSGCSTGC